VRERTTGGASTARDHGGAIRRLLDGAGTVCEASRFMESTQTTPASLSSSTSDQDLRPRARTLSWMASMSVAAGEIRAAEGYLLELLAWCAFAERDAPEETTGVGDGA
jgi:hypothetical protein